MQAGLDRISKDKKKQLEIQYKNQIEDEKLMSILNLESNLKLIRQLK